ncbi:MAG: DNA/RNA nuclease SfsA, partial [Proteobacteria bacterium]|nr:DNA/RNA nuclease SfsA [Pseudomonadota bacterium]
RMDAKLFRPADSIDPAYGMALRAAAQQGVEIMVYDVKIDIARIELRRPVPLDLSF